MGIMDAFNDEAGKVNNSKGKYRVMQVVLREKFVGKGSKNFSEIEDLCNMPKGTDYTLLHSRLPGRLASAAVTAQSAILCSNESIKLKRCL